jgi:hypothetical protein
MIVEMTEQDVLYVSRNIRDIDYRELTASRWTEGKSKQEICEEIAEEASSNPGIAWTCYLKNEPVGIGGIATLVPKVGTAWFFGTDKLKNRSWAELTRHCRKLMHNILEISDLHRVEALTVDFHKESHFWLEKIGMKKESTLVKRGQNGEDFHIFAIVKE